jgi:hypothetical protein
MVGQFGDDGLEAGHVPPEYAYTRDSSGDVEGLNNKVPSGDQTIPWISYL